MDAKITIDWRTVLLGARGSYRCVFNSGKHENKLEEGEEGEEEEWDDGAVMDGGERKSSRWENWVCVSKFD